MPLTLDLDTGYDHLAIDDPEDAPSSSSSFTRPLDSSSFPNGSPPEWTSEWTSVAAGSATLAQPSPQPPSDGPFTPYGCSPFEVNCLQFHNSYTQPFNTVFETTRQPPTDELSNTSTEELGGSDPAFGGEKQCAIGNFRPREGPPSSPTDGSARSASTTITIPDAQPTTSVSPASIHKGSCDSKNRRERERNRVAANKCRQKAKRNVAALEQRRNDLAQRHTFLVDQAESLRQCVLQLKNEILQHSHCNSEVIQNYITKAAHEVVSKDDRVNR
ncbi:hypothetical protein F4778DRAFT_733382 [Xylariomycetidae sp. FL2044]|nr:hypothetical protein F4778DRAFT_733382 [Xylariomycetidae sp. FL2044]